MRQYKKMRQEDWREIRNCVHTRVMLECEREYQEHLLLSVMPAYIAAEVVLKIMRKDFKETKKKFIQIISNIILLQHASA